MIYVDDPITYKASFPEYCHMWSDTFDVDELNKFAESIGLKESWLQCSHGITIKNFWHYDLSKNKRTLALQKGAIYKPLHIFLKEIINGRNE